MVTTDIIIQAMNSVANESQLDELEEAEEVARQQPAEDAEVGEEIAEAAQETPAENPEEIPPLVENAAERDAEEEKNEPDVVEVLEPAVTTRSGRSIIRPSRYLQVTMVSREDSKMEASTTAINAELKMLFKN
jgi:hypothetical protein